MSAKSKQNGVATRVKAQVSLDGRMQRFLMSARGKRKGEATEYDQWVCACLALREIALEQRGG